MQGEYYIDFKGKKVGTSAILTNMLGNVALLVTSEDNTSKEVGDEVTILLID
jgi:molybdopterin molybdotransferase